ncbi:hypothetical protein BCR35DRAFT_355244 [Leucosporidium creatinivorum]|uniref:Tr-type G domain-containing protein n=1 Tax=Leucosporidium creatinivorum TaxID=106004 RepID=A0A1Y2DMM0_9BASI|nr:hypothetical protein BCR35DRAFT_355244 [Leucosporidium creatinivorum]
MSSALLRCTCSLRSPSLSLTRSLSTTPALSIRPRPSPNSSGDSNSPRRPRSWNPPKPEGEWRSTRPPPSTPTSKSAYLSSPSHTSLPKPRIGQALALWQALSPEERRREDLARERIVRDEMGGSWNKLYALERERERVWNSKIDGVRRGQGQERLQGEERLRKSARNVLPGQERPFRPAAGEEKPKWRRGEKDRESGKGGRPNPSSPQAQAMVPGRVNRNTVAQSVDRNVVQPVVRGGAAQKTGGAGSKRKQQKKELKKVTLPSTVRLENLTNLLGVKLFHLQKAMTRIGLTNTHASRLLTAEDASLLALDLGFDPTIDDDLSFDLYALPPPTPDQLATLPLARLSRESLGEAGGITQHIGAFEVSVPDMVANLTGAPSPSSSTTSGAQTITFLDTPGHAAFTAMRSRGAGVTDVVVLVVAADDGVKPQTEEVIKLVKDLDGEVGTVVAITKCDKQGVDTLKLKQSLLSHGLELETFGGDIPCVEVSSLTGQGLPELLETVSAVADFRELRAEREGRVEARVVESRVVKGRGNVATLLILRGCLRPTSTLVAGTTWCRVRSLLSPSSSPLSFAYPGQPVEVTGWRDLPSSGSLVLEAPSEADAKKVVENRVRREEEKRLWSDLEVINEKREVEARVGEVRREEERAAREQGLKGGRVAQAGQAAVEGIEGASEGEGTKELLLIIKADVSGTVEAVVGALEGIGNKEARVKIISSAVGDVQESDVEMARAVGASIVGFNVKAPSSVLKSAAKPPSPIHIHISPIIYRLVDTIRLATASLLPKTIETRVHGEALVQQLFEIGVKGKKEAKKVAGCKVGNGVFMKSRKARVVRGGEVLHVGTVSTLKQVKKDVLEIPKGVECGIALDDWDGFEPDDLIQSIEEIEVVRTL